MREPTGEMMYKGKKIIILGLVFVLRNGCWILRKDLVG